jgi:hypothetical protein
MVVSSSCKERTNIEVDEVVVKIKFVHQYKIIVGELHIMEELL